MTAFHYRFAPSAVRCPLYHAPRKTHRPLIDEYRISRSFCVTVPLRGAPDASRRRLPCYTSQLSIKGSKSCDGHQWGNTSSFPVFRSPAPFHSLALAFYLLLPSTCISSLFHSCLLPCWQHLQSHSKQTRVVPCKSSAMTPNQVFRVISTGLERNPLSILGFGWWANDVSRSTCLTTRRLN